MIFKATNGPSAELHQLEATLRLPFGWGKKARLQKELTLRRACLEFAHAADCGKSALRPGQKKFARI